MQALWDSIFTVNEQNFESVALQVYEYQYKQVEVYRLFNESLRITPAMVKRLADIPFLPIQFFKSHPVIAESKTAQKIFESSGTTGVVTSRHRVADLNLYEQSFIKGFELFYGSVTDYVILGLLPSYLERNNSSLVYMVDALMKVSGQPEDAFFLYENEKLNTLLLQLKAKGKKVILVGVTFALLDFAEQFTLNFPELIIMETGGMKGRRAELTREEVHEKLKAAFGVPHIHSEYGMTELLSQGYSKGEGIFECVPWMKIVLRDMYDPFKIETQSGAINVIDLANLYSCSFIATNDVGRMHGNQFEILGRMDNAELRGCNLMYA
ncbi:MAG: acyl transferase [Chitinophagales bacterium]